MKRSLDEKHIEKSTWKMRHFDTHGGLCQSEEGECMWTYSTDGAKFYSYFCTFLFHMVTVHLP